MKGHSLGISFQRRLAQPFLLVLQFSTLEIRAVLIAASAIDLQAIGQRKISHYRRLLATFGYRLLQWALAARRLVLRSFPRGV